MPTPLATFRRSFNDFRKTRQWRSFFLFLYTCGTIVFVNDKIIETTYINGASMSPTLSPDFETERRRDLVLWKKWNPTKNLQRGDVVHFSTPHKAEGLAVKRVIAVEGDTVKLDKRRRPYRREGPEIPEARAWDALNGSIKVPRGHVWVEGDAVGNSTDSNDYGPISKSLITGSAVAVVWPPARFGATPWKGYRSSTKVKQTVEREAGDRSMPIGLEELSDPHLPR